MTRCHCLQFAVEKLCGQRLFFNHPDWPLSHSSKLVDFICLSTYVFAFELLRYFLPVQFVYRYLVICREMKIKLCFLLAMLIPAVFLSMITVSLITLQYYFYGNKVRVDMIANLFHIDQNQTTVALFSPNDSPYSAYINSYVLLTNLIVYTLIIYMSLKVWKCINESSAKLEIKRAKAVNRQISVVLIIQRKLIVGLELTV
uniref:Uncharacterized protein n=1 Tax=Ditylenchus dipsaci TaxID=166011 RepID=A0A915EII2_9BILA